MARSSDALPSEYPKMKRIFVPNVAFTTRPKNVACESDDEPPTDMPRDFKSSQLAIGSLPQLSTTAVPPPEEGIQLSALGSNLTASGCSSGASKGADPVAPM